VKKKVKKSEKNVCDRGLSASVQTEAFKDGAGAAM